MESVTIGDLDRQLVQCLGLDGRASFSAIAAVLGVSDQTVARRYRRLRAAGVIRVVGLRYTRSISGANWFLRLRCVPGAGEAIATALARRSDTKWIQLLSGDTEVLCGLVADRAAAGTESLLARLPRSDRIVAVTAYSLMHVFAGGPDPRHFLDVLPAQQVAPLRVPAPDWAGKGAPDEPAPGDSGLDSALFAALALDGRTPYAELAAAVGWSESTVRRRVDQLRDTGALYYDLELDTAAFGFRCPAWLWLWVPPSHLAAVGAALGEFPEIAFVTATSGPSNLAACAVCRDDESLYQFLTTSVGALPGIERMETSPIIRTVKQASPVMVPRP